MSAREEDLPEEPETVPDEPEEARARPGHRIVLQRAPLSARELAFSFVLFLPWGLLLLVASSVAAGYVLVAVLLGAALGILFRRLPTPAPSIAALPVGVVWIGAVVLLPPGPWDLATGLLAGGAILLYSTLPSPTELALPLEAIAAQASIPLVGGALSFAVALSLLGVSAPIFDVALVPMLGALALVVYLFGRTDVVPSDAAPPPAARPADPREA